MSSAEDDELSLKANLLLSDLFSELGRTEESIAVLEPLNEISATFAAASIYMSKNQFEKASDQYEMLVAMLPEASICNSSCFPSGYFTARIGQSFFLAMHFPNGTASVLLGLVDRPRLRQSLMDFLHLKTIDKAARALIQSMIFAGYAAEKYLDNQDGADDETLLCRSWRWPNSCCHGILARVFLRHRSTQNDSVVLVIKKPTRKKDLSLKLKLCRLSLRPWQLPRPSGRRGMLRSIRALRSNLISILRTASSENRQ